MADVTPPADPAAPRTKSEVLAALEITRGSVEELSARIEGLASKEELAVVKLEQDRRTRRLAYAVGGAILLFLLVLGVVSELREVADANRETAVGQAEIIRSQARLLDELVECTTPADPGGEPHECFERGQESQARAVAIIVEQVVAAMDERLRLALEAAGLTVPPAEPPS